MNSLCFGSHIVIRFVNRITKSVHGGHSDSRVSVWSFGVVHRVLSTRTHTYTCYCWSSKIAKLTELMNCSSSSKSVECWQRVRKVAFAYCLCSKTVMRHLWLKVFCSIFVDWWFSKFLEHTWYRPRKGGWSNGCRINIHSSMESSNVNLLSIKSWHTILWQGSY